MNLLRFNSISSCYYSKLLWSVTFSLMIFLTTFGQTTTTKTFIIDTTSVLRNPCVGWAIYCEGWEFENTWRSIYPEVTAEKFWKQMDSISAHKYATHIYISILWSALEPEEGKYAWKYNKNYMQFIEEAKKRKLKLSFRVYCSTMSRTEEGTPKYVFDAGAGYSWDSGIRNGREYKVRDAFMDDPIFLEKFENFVKAFAHEYDNSDITDYVDGFGAGWWGEGHHNNMKDKNNLPMLIDRLTGMYYKNFKNIITVYNLAHKHPDPTIVSDFELARELVYEKRGFLPRRDGLGSHWFSKGDRDMMQYYFFPRNIPLIGEGCYWLHNPIGETRMQFLNDTRFKMSNWAEALKIGLDDALNYHSNTFDLRVPKEAKLWIKEMPDQVQRFITKGGYRLLPESITFSNEVSSNGRINITHTWKNTGVGLLPNNHPNWNKKYKVAFGLFDTKTKKLVSKIIAENTNPGTWIKGRFYTYQNEVDFVYGKDSLLLAVSIFDTKKNEPGLELSVKEKSTDKWYPVGMVYAKKKNIIELDKTGSSKLYETKNLMANNSDGAAITFDPNIPEELRARGGLPNFLTKLNKKGTVRIAYLGGTISEANGWRIKSLNWLKSLYPKVNFKEFNASISETGSDFAACRLNPDVLAHNPDLIFLEHRIDGGSGFEEQSVEGIIRQIWKQNPRTDICFIHPVTLNMLPTLQDRRNTAFGAVMESIANKYNIPSIDLGVEIAKLEMSAELAMKSDLPVAGKLWFSMDGVNPGEVGHDLYTEIFIRSFSKMKEYIKEKDHQLSEAMNNNNWEKTTLLPITNTNLSSGWNIVNTEKDTIYAEEYKRTDGILRGAVKCNKSGETVKIKWKGTTLGFTDIPNLGGCKLQITINNNKPIIIERNKTEKRNKASIFYLPEQSPGEHTAEIKIIELPVGAEYYLGQVLVIGSF